MSRQRYIVLFQVAFIVVAGWQLYDFAQSDRLTVEEGKQQVVDSNDGRTPSMHRRSGLR